MASQIAVEYHKHKGANNNLIPALYQDSTSHHLLPDEELLQSKEMHSPDDVSEPLSPSLQESMNPGVLVIGGAVVDVVGNFEVPTVMNTSNPGHITTSYGGVGFNIATAMAKLGTSVTMATAISDDSNGRGIILQARDIGIDTSLVKVVPGESKVSTATYMAIHGSDGDLCVGVADMEVLKYINVQYVGNLTKAIEKSSLVVVDGNISKDSFETLVTICKHYEKSIVFEPTSDFKCLVPFQANAIQEVKADR